MNKYYLIGEHLPHSASPFIHTALFGVGDRSCQYELLEIPSGELEQYLPVLKSAGGFNITIPYKQDIIPFLDEIDDRARFYNSVNTVKVEDGKLKGYNTDCLGFLGALALKNIPLSGKVLLLGNGGVASMVACEALLAGCELTVAGRNLESVQNFAKKVEAKFEHKSVQTSTLDSVTGKFDLLVNCTPVGMFPNTDACPVSQAVISQCGAVYDLIYNPENTKLVERARALGTPCDSGTSMLVIQAAKAQEIWFDTQFSDSEILDITRQTSCFIKDNF